MTTAKIKASLVSVILLSVFLAAPLPAIAEEEAPDPAQIARGAKAWGNNCGRCHNIRDPKEHTDDEWEVSVMHMRKVANLPGELTRDIAAFLKANN